jgi:hypothetical protein
MIRIVLLGVILACALARAGQTAPVTSYPPDWPHRAPWKLNRELLLPETERIVFVVDLPVGAPPFPEALDHLVTLASKYGGRPASWVRLGAPGSPAVQWIEPPGPPKPVSFYVRLQDGQSLSDVHLPRDHIESIRFAREIPACPAGPLPTNLSFVFVRYIGYVGRDYANSDVVVSDTSCGGREFPYIHVAQTTIALGHPPGFGEDFLEPRALAHEYGHVLGLASNPAHGRWLGVVPYRGAPHCIHRECAVSPPSAMALLKGQMLDYCSACRADIDEAREHWRTGKEFPEVPRLPQPDPAAHVASLKKYNFREGGEAEKLVGYGKAVMPALVARLSELPGGSGASPRGYAAQLALKIVLVEDVLRRPPGTLDPILPQTAADMSAAVMSWWSAESGRFMGGDDWTLPSMLRVPRAKE